MGSDVPQEKWREDFPIMADEDQYVSRREFTKFMVMVSGATCVGNAWFVAQKFINHSQSFPSVEIAKDSEILPGQVKLFRYPTEDDAAMLLRLKSGELVAFTQRCTHLSCPVHFAPQTDRLECPCHNGAFDARTGQVLEGPPPRPLPKIILVVKNGSIFAEGIQGT